MSLQSEFNHAQIDYNLLSFIAHESKGPFNGLIGFSELLCTNKPALSPEQHESYTELVHQLAVKSFLQVQTLIVWIKLISNNLTIQTGIVNYSDLLEQTIASLRVDLISKKIEINASIVPLSTKGDQHLLSIALANLLYSTFRYNGENSIILLETEETSRSLLISIPYSADFKKLLNNTLKNPELQTEQNFRVWIAFNIFKQSNIMLSQKVSADSKLIVISLTPEANA